MPGGRRRPQTRPSRACRSRAVSSSESGESSDRRRVHLAAAPAGSPGQQFGARGAEDEERDAARPVDEVVDEVEERFVGPMQVLEDEHERPLLGDRLQEAAPGGERLVARRSPAASSASSPTSGRRCRSIQAASSFIVDEALAPPRLNFSSGLIGAVGLENPRLRLDHLAERPEGHSLAIRERAAVSPVDEPEITGLDRLEELEHEPALADTGHSDERDELRLALADHAGEGLAQEFDLLLAADQPSAADPLDRDAGPRLLRLPDGDRLGLALGFDRARLARTRSRARSLETSSRRRGCRWSARPPAAGRRC